MTDTILNNEFNILLMQFHEANEGYEYSLARAKIVEYISNWHLTQTAQLNNHYEDVKELIQEMMKENK